MGSSLVAWVKKRSRAEGRAEGELTAARALCADLVRQQHPGSVPIVGPIIAACADAQRLRDWALAVARSSEGEFVRLVTESRSAETLRRRAGPSSRASRRRAPAPSRRSRRR